MHPKSKKQKPALVAQSIKQAWLSDLEWTSARVGWRKPCCNHYYTEGKDDLRLLFEIDGHFHPKALYAHAPSHFPYDLGGKWKSFSTTFGFQGGATNEAHFVIKGDGKVLYRSEIVKPGKEYEAKVDVSAISKLELLVEEGTQGPGNSWTIWLSPKIKR